MTYPVTTTLFSFDGGYGANPDAGLVADGNGNLFGTTFTSSTVFEIANTGSTAKPDLCKPPENAGRIKRPGPARCAVRR